MVAAENLSFLKGINTHINVDGKGRVELCIAGLPSLQTSSSKEDSLVSVIAAITYLEGQGKISLCQGMGFYLSHNGQEFHDPHIYIGETNRIPLIRIYAGSQVMIPPSTFFVSDRFSHCQALFIQGQQGLNYFRHNWGSELTEGTNFINSIATEDRIRRAVVVARDPLARRVIQTSLSRLRVKGENMTIEGESLKEEFRFWAYVDEQSDLTWRTMPENK